MCSCLVVSSSVSLTVCPGSANFFARTTVCRWKMEIDLICVPAGVTQSGSSCGSHVSSRCTLVLPGKACSWWKGGECGDLMKYRRVYYV